MSGSWANLGQTVRVQIAEVFNVAKVIGSLCEFE